MKIVRSFILVILTSFMVSNIYAMDIFLNVDLVEREQSLDSSENTYSLLIKNKHILYFFENLGEYPYGKLKEKKIKKLTDDEYKKILQILSDPVFENNITEIKPMDQIGLSIELDMLLKKDKSLIHSKIQGMTHIMKTRETNIKHLNLYKKIKSIISLFKSGKY